MKDVIIIGAGDLGRQLRHMLAQNQSNQAYNVLGWLDDTKPKGERIDTLPVIGGLNETDQLDKSISFVLGIGYNHLSFKNELIDKLVAEDRDLISIIHHSAIVDPAAVIKPGVIIYPGCIIDKGVKLENGSLLNNGVIVSHDSTIGATSFVAPGVTICGNVNVGSRCFVGAGTVIKDGLTVADDVILGSGFNVVNSIQEKGTYIQKAITSNL